MTLHPLTSKGGAFVSKLGLVFRNADIYLGICIFILPARKSGYNSMPCILKPQCYNRIGICGGAL